MNILFLFISYPEKLNASSLTKDLSDEFTSRGDGAYVVTIREDRNNLPTELSVENNTNVLRVKTRNMFGKINKIEKFISMMTIHKSIAKEVVRIWPDVDFDIIVGTSPYMFQKSLIHPLKKYYNCKTFLILWDMFPQNAKDLGFIKNKYLFKYLKYKERCNLELFDYIGCQSIGNLKYMKEKYKFLDMDLLHIFPQWSVVNNEIIANKISIRNKYGFSQYDFLLVFGGNMGVPQNLTKIIDVARKMQYQKNIKFIFIGNGTEREKLERKVRRDNTKNVIFIHKMDRREYQNLLSSCDVGIISLDPRFTFPNFPSKILDYLKYGVPILASLDSHALDDAGYLIEYKIQAGLASDANHIEEFEENLLNMYENSNICKEFSQNGKRYFRENFDVVDR